MVRQKNAKKKFVHEGNEEKKNGDYAGVDPERHEKARVTAKRTSR